jgi:hypothetical protein
MLPLLLLTLSPHPMTTLLLTLSPHPMTTLLLPLLSPLQPTLGTEQPTRKENLTNHPYKTSFLLGPTLSGLKTLDKKHKYIKTLDNWSYGLEKTRILKKLIINFLDFTCFWFSFFLKKGKK